MGSTAALQTPTLFPSSMTGRSSTGEEMNGSVARPHCSRVSLCCPLRRQSSRLLSLRFGKGNLRQTAWNELESTVKGSGKRTTSCGREELTGTVMTLGWREMWASP